MEKVVNGAGVVMYWFGVSLGVLTIGAFVVWLLTQFPLFSIAWFGWCAFMLQLKADVHLYNAWKKYRTERLTNSDEKKENV